MAGSIFVAQYSGARQHRMVSHVAAQTILMVVLVSVALSVLGSLAADLVLRATGIAPNVLVLGSAYVRITFLGLVCDSLTSARRTAHSRRDPSTRRCKKTFIRTAIEMLSRSQRARRG